MFPDCVLPGCPALVGEWGQACTGCVAAFGPMLRVGGPALTERDIYDRDNHVRHEYATQQRLRSHR